MISRFGAWAVDTAPCEGGRWEDDSIFDPAGVKSCGVSKKPIQDVGRLLLSWVRFSRSKYFIMEMLPGETGK